MRQSPSYLITTVFQSVKRPYEISEIYGPENLAAGVWPVGRIVIFGRLRMDLDGFEFSDWKNFKKFSIF